VALAWTSTVVYGLLSLLAAKLLGSDAPWQTQIDHGLQEAYLLLLGGPYAAAVIAKYTAVATEGAANKTIAPEASPAKDARNLIADDDGDTDLGDFQYVLFNLVALAFFFGNFVPHLSSSPAFSRRLSQLPKQWRYGAGASFTTAWRRGSASEGWRARRWR
jgi:hypothetical protein